MTDELEAVVNESVMARERNRIRPNSGDLKREMSLEIYQREVIKEEQIQEKVHKIPDRNHRNDVQGSSVKIHGPEILFEALHSDPAHGTQDDVLFLEHSRAMEDIMEQLNHEQDIDSKKNDPLIVIGCSDEI